MKATFTCEKCGAERPHTTTWGKRSVEEQRGDIEVKFRIMPCPNCAKTTYGPLTEDMVAEAVKVAWDGDRDADSISTARFVLRLLKAMEALGNEYFRLTNTDASARRELLDLAREP